jgi:hypothetical protein
MALVIAWWPENDAVNVNANTGRRFFRALDKLQRSKAFVCVSHDSVSPTTDGAQASLS